MDDEQKQPGEGENTGTPATPAADEPAATPSTDTPADGAATEPAADQPAE